jgi:hypothetical protein
MIFIDHIDGDRTNNRIRNLRLVTDSGNKQNKPQHRNGQPIGVVFRDHLKKKKWIAYAPANFINRRAKKQKYIGSYITQEEAANAVIEFCTKGQDDGDSY